MMKSKVCEILLSPGRSTNTVTFSFKEMVLGMVANKSLFHRKHIFLDQKILDLNHLILYVVVISTLAHGS